MPSVNLAPSTQLAVAAGRRRRRLFLLSILIVLIVALVWGGLFFYQSTLDQNLQATQSQVRKVESEIARLASDADRVQSFESRLNAVSLLLNSHVNWDPVLQSVEQLLPQTVTLKAINVQEKTGKMTVEGVTSDVDQVSQSLASFLADKNNSVFTSGKLTSVLRKTSGTPDQGITVNYDFQIELAFSPSVLTSSK